MPIKQFSFPESHVMPNGKMAPEQIERMAGRYENDARHLEQGVYDLTPRTWRREQLRYRLIVHKGGELATFQTLSPTACPATQDWLAIGENNDPNERIIAHQLIPEDTTAIGVLTPTVGFAKDLHQNELWEIAMYVEPVMPAKYADVPRLSQPR